MLRSRTEVLKEFNSVLMKKIFAHHPSCNLYDHHVFKIGNWSFCVGCTGLYSAIVIVFTIDLLMGFSLSVMARSIVGFAAFIPALVQLRWKSRYKHVKFMMRFSLGVSAYLLFSLIFTLPELVFRILMALLYIFVVRFYSFRQSRVQLIECIGCPKGRQYDTCDIRYGDVLKIHDLKLIEEVLPEGLNRILEQRGEYCND